MSVFNSSYFDTFVYNGTDTTSPLAFNRFLSGDVTGNTGVSSVLRLTSALKVDATGNTNIIPKLTSDVVFSSTVDGTSSVTSNLFEYNSLNLLIDSSSSVISDLRLLSILKSDITGNSNATATMTEYEFLSSTIDASSTVEAYALTKNNEVILKSNIYTGAIVSPNLNPDYTEEFLGDVTGSTYISADLSVFSPVLLSVTIDATSDVTIGELLPDVNMHAIVDASSNVIGNFKYQTVTLSADITGRATVSDKINRDVRLTLVRKSKIVGASAVIYYENEPVQINGKTNVSGPNNKLELSISNLMRFGKIRRLPFVSPGIEKIDGDNLDTFFKIMKLYESLSNSRVILESTRRQSQEELDVYLMGDNPDIRWKSDEGTLNGFESGWLDSSGTPTIPVNFKAYVANGATGVFRNKDGYFAVYVGKDKR